MPAFGLALCDVFAPCERAFAETSGALDGDDGDLVAYYYSKIYFIFTYVFAW